MWRVIGDQLAVSRITGKNGTYAGGKDQVHRHIGYSLAANSLPIEQSVFSLDRFE